MFVSFLTFVRSLDGVNTNSEVFLSWEPKLEDLRIELALAFFRLDSFGALDLTSELSFVELADTNAPFVESIRLEESVRKPSSDFFLDGDVEFDCSSEWSGIPFVIHLFDRDFLLFWVSSPSTPSDTNRLVESNFGALEVHVLWAWWPESLTVSSWNWEARSSLGTLLRRFDSESNINLSSLPFVVELTLLRWSEIGPFSLLTWIPDGSLDLDVKILLLWLKALLLRFLFGRLSGSTGKSQSLDPVDNRTFPSLFAFIGCTSSPFSRGSLTILFNGSHGNLEEPSSVVFASPASDGAPGSVAEGVT